MLPVSNTKKLGQGRKIQLVTEEGERIPLKLSPEQRKKKKIKEGNVKKSHTEYMTM